MLWGDKPSFFSVIKAGMFAVFFPHDLHMPNVFIDKPAYVKKVVIKVAVR
jgi:YhcH/YjgK/YiaL family protein